MKTETYKTHSEALDRATELELVGFEATVKQIGNAYIIEWRA
jgi:hypothetical protein